MPLAKIRDFLRLEASGGIVMIFAATAAIILANSPLNSIYQQFLEIPGSIQVGNLVVAKPLLLWVNDLWMAVFFFLVGLEIKREFLEGELSSRADIALPALAAVGGIVVPVLIYVLMNQGNAANLNGWAIPAATDIAFALAILALLGNRIPLSLKVLLTAIAIFDDLGAVVFIALFYTAELSILSLSLAAAGIVALVALNYFKVNHVAAYLLVGAFIWVCVLKSGVHATLAGVITALAIPLRVEDEDGHSLLKHLEHALHPWVAFLVLPMFAFANAGVSLEGISLASFVEPVTLGIALGLFVGKQVGIFVPIWLAIKSGIAPMPNGAGWAQLYGISLLCGIGFTMSFFIGGLAFELSDFDAPVRLGVLTGSILSAIAGYAVLRFARSGEGYIDEE